MLRVGIDTGGTNTDLVAIDEQGGIVISKRPSTVAAPEIGVLDAFDASGIAPEEAQHFVLGTTIATNARLQGTIAPHAMSLARVLNWQPGQFSTCLDRSVIHLVLSAN